MTLIGRLQSEFLDLSCLDSPLKEMSSDYFLFLFFFSLFFFNLEMPIIGPVD